MQIQYLGTAAAEGLPAVFCNCQYCRTARALGGKNIRTRAQVLIDGELSIDFPPDAYHHALACGADLSAIRYLIVSHAHMDHFYACDFVLRGEVYAHEMTSPVLDIYANAEALEIYREQTRREMHKGISDAIRLHTVKPFQRLAFGEYTVHTLAANHSSREPMLFLIEKGEKRILHLYDTGGLTQETLEALRTIGGPACDLINFDCTMVFGESYEGARHMGLPEDKRTLEKLTAIGLADGHTKKVVTHFSHNHAPLVDVLARAEREYGFIAAYDGMTLEL